MGLLFAFGLAAVAFAITFAATPFYAKRALAKGIFGRDVNKAGHPRVAEMGGLAVFAGVASSVSLGILFLTFIDANFALLTLLLAALAALSLTALIGVFDDLFKLTWKTKALMPLAAALPLVAVKAGETVMSIPFVGDVDFGLFYTFILVPLGVTGAANAFNMSAGYNGLEAGIGFIVSAALLAIAVASGSTAAVVVLAALAGACLAFLKFNWFPARVFPGDVGTLVVGVGVASAAIIGNLEKFAVILIIPAFYELAATVYYAAKGVWRRPACHNPVIAKDGRLKPPKGAEYYTLFYLILSKKPLREADLVKTVYAVYAAFAAIALAVYWLRV